MASRLCEMEKNVIFGAAWNIEEDDDDDVI